MLIRVIHILTSFLTGTSYPCLHVQEQAKALTVCQQQAKPRPGDITQSYQILGVLSIASRKNCLTYAATKPTMPPQHDGPIAAYHALTPILTEPTCRHTYRKRRRQSSSPCC